MKTLTVVAFAGLLLCSCRDREKRCEKARELYLRESQAEMDAALANSAPQDRALISAAAEREATEAKKNFVPVCLKRVDAELSCIEKGPKQAKADALCQQAMWRLNGDLASTLDGTVTRNALSKPVASFNVKQLVAEFEENEVAAAGKYQSRLVKVTDVVTEIVAGNGHSALTMGEDKAVAAAKFDSDGAVLFVKKGEKASVECVLNTRIAGLITLVDCELVR